MEFKESQAIYMQIVDFICDQIMTRKWAEEERIPSVRELGVLLEVNPNTVMRAYEWLQNKEIIFNRRGIGFFVAGSAGNQIAEMRRHDFIKKELPEIYRKILLLEIPIGDIVLGFDKYRCRNGSEIKDPDS